MTDKPLVTNNPTMIEIPVQDRGRVLIGTAFLLPTLSVTDGCDHGTVALDRAQMIAVADALLDTVKALDDARRGRDPGWFALPPPTVHQTPDE